MFICYLTNEINELAYCIYLLLYIDSGWWFLNVTLTRRSI